MTEAPPPDEPYPIVYLDVLDIKIREGPGSVTAPHTSLSVSI